MNEYLVVWDERVTYCATVRAASFEAALQTLDDNGYDDVEMLRSEMLTNYRLEMRDAAQHSNVQGR